MKWSHQPHLWVRLARTLSELQSAVTGVLPRVKEERRDPLNHGMKPCSGSSPYRTPCRTSSTKLFPDRAQRPLCSGTQPVTGASRKHWYALPTGTRKKSTRLALQLFLVKGFKLYSFQLQDPKGPCISIYCHYLPVSGLGNLRACCLPWMW